MQDTYDGGPSGGGGRSGGKPTAGRWTAEEKQRFEEAIQLYGKDWKSIQRHVGTRSGT